MVIAVFGGSGKTGYSFILQAVEAGYGVRALLRNPEAFPEIPGVIKIQGDVLDGGKVMLTLSGAQKVFLALGQTKNNPPQVVSRGTSLILQGMKHYSLTRILALTSMGVGESVDQVPLFFKFLSKTILKGTMEDKEKQELQLKNSGLQWTVVRPGNLVDEETGEIKIGLDLETKAGKVQRQKVALKSLEILIQDLFIGQCPYLT